MIKNQYTIRELLERELRRRSFATNKEMTVDDLFCKEQVGTWIETLITKYNPRLKSIIDCTSEERLSHTASTYLFGMAIRDRLNIHFDLLPLLIKNGTGDAFHFFWAIVCLCHDLGYEFEKGKYSLNKMDTSKGRKELFKIEHDLFEVKNGDLIKFGIDVNKGEGKWILNAIELAGKYDKYRRQTDHKDPDHKPVIDHGISGALILYDILYEEYEHLIKERNDACIQRQNTERNSSDIKNQGNLDGIQKDVSAVRFITCCLIIACTVARHNMWLANSKTEDVYKKYGLTALLPNDPNARISANSPFDQMLFLLGFIDTIDPVKSIYTRYAECNEATDSELSTRKRFLLDNVRIEFVGPYNSDYRWGNSLTYREFRLNVVHANNLFDEYVNGASHLDEWLVTRKPVRDDSKICYFLPSYCRKENVWDAGITDHEVDALLLYEGCGVPGKYGDFYTSSSPYQTFNLLMMPGDTGEKVRVCLEKQNPASIYIKEWKKTLEVMTDIFIAQCKYSIYCNKNGEVLNDVLYRGDREANFQLMQECGGTFALTSTSKGGYLNKFLSGKRNPHLLKIKIDNNIPYIDYSGFFKENYVFSGEQEILLPPYIKMTEEKQPEKLVEGIGNVQNYYIHLTGFNPMMVNEDEFELIDFLTHNCDEAAKGLQELVQKRDMKYLPNDHIYWKWKTSFQTLCRICMQNIHSLYFRSNP